MVRQMIDREMSTMWSALDGAVSGGSDLAAGVQGAQSDGTPLAGSEEGDDIKEKVEGLCR